MKIIKSIMSLMLFFSLGSSAKILSYQGVLDQIEGEHASILIESLQTSLIVHTESLPPNSQTNMWFVIEFIEGTYKVSRIDYRTTKKQAEKSFELIKSLQKRIYE